MFIRYFLHIFLRYFSHLDQSQGDYVGGSLKLLLDIKGYYRYSWTFFYSSLIMFTNQKGIRGFLTYYWMIIVITNIIAHFLYNTLLILTSQKSSSRNNLQDYLTGFEDYLPMLMLWVELDLQLIINIL